MSTDEGATRYRRIWIGGTSGLARTFFNAFQNPRQGSMETIIEGTTEDSPWLIFGHERQAPAWLSEFHGLAYRKVDFLYPGTWNEKLLQADCQHVQQIVISIRPPLVSHHTFSQAAEVHNQMIDGLQEFIRDIIKVKRKSQPSSDGDDNAEEKSLLHIIHASSIAAIDHVKEQRLRSEASIPDPPSSALYHPYDRFKRRCEEVLDAIVKEQTRRDDSFRVTHVRLGAFFSDDPLCIQCCALSLQGRIGCYLPTRIDCNSARNVAVLLRAMLMKSPPVEAVRYFFYTRPLSFSSPVPYGEYLIAYRKAYDMIFYCMIPLLLVQWFVRLVHTVACKWPTLPYIQSVDYLLQVTLQEHTFDLSLVAAAYPGVAAKEETMEECFRRRRYYLKHRGI